MRWEDKLEWIGLEFGKSQRAVENRRETGRDRARQIQRVRD